MNHLPFLGVNEERQRVIQKKVVASTFLGRFSLASLVRRVLGRRDASTLAGVSEMGAEEGPSIKISVQPVRSNDQQCRCSRTAAVLGSKFSAIRYNPRVPGIQPVLVPVCTRYKWRTHPCSTLCTNITTSATMYLLNQVQKWNRGPHKKCAQATAYY